MDTLQKKILCPSILNLSTDNMREEIEKLDATDMDIYHVDIMMAPLYRTSACRCVSWK